MAAINYQTRNRDNMRALVEHLLRTENPQYNSIEYKQAGTMVLLGKYHSDRDLGMVANGFSGTLQIYKDKTKHVLQPTEHKIMVWIKPEGVQKSRMGELEGAIEDAIRGTPDVLPGWPIRFEWV